MIVDHRTYTIHPGKTPTFTKIYQELGYPLQQRHLGDCIGWYVSMDIGELNQIVHLWRYKDLSDRAERRTKLAADENWMHYLTQATPLIQTMKNKILSAGPFFDLEKLTYNNG